MSTPTPVPPVAVRAANLLAYILHGAPAPVGQVDQDAMELLVGDGFAVVADGFLSPTSRGSQWSLDHWLTLDALGCHEHESARLTHPPLRPTQPA